MDTKTSILPYTSEEEAAPPSYSDTISSYHPTPSASSSQYYSSQIQSQITSLTTQISSIQTQKDILTHAHDEKILGLLTHHIQIYLSDFANTGLAKGSLILVPAKGVQDPKAVPTDYDFSETTEYDRVVKVSDKENGSYMGKELWYWDDEAMAKRLARHLRPTRDPRTLELPKRKEQIQPQQQAKGWRLIGRKKKEDRPPLIEERQDSQIQIDAKRLGRDYEDRVVVDVVAEELVFRTENEYGMYEVERGWGIVLKIRVDMGKK